MSWWRCRWLQDWFDHEWLSLECDDDRQGGLCMTTFEPKQCKQQVCKAKVKNRVDRALELKCENRNKMCLKLHQWVSRRELVDKVSLCCASLRACTAAAPGSGTTTQLLVTRWVVNDYRNENLILWVLNKLKLMWSWSGLKASLEAWILSAFQWIPAEIPLETS